MNMHGPCIGNLWTKKTHPSLLVQGQQFGFILFLYDFKKTIFCFTLHPQDQKLILLLFYITFKNDINRKQFCSTVIWWFPFIFPQMPTAGKDIIGLWLIVLAAVNLSQGK